MHRETCALHADPQATTCFGTLKRGGICTNRVTAPAIPGMLPTCKIHQNQLRASGSCGAQMPCGFECGRLLPWIAHGLKLCPDHREGLVACYFLQLPTEMRLRVYRFLLPDRPITARYVPPRALASDGQQACTAILRVNHQIHDEVAGLLYSNNTFTIELSKEKFHMCNLDKTELPYEISDGGNHALQDYQMQLMLLEQQKKKRLMMSHQQQDHSNGESSSTGPPATACIPAPKIALVTDEFKLIGPTWNPRLSERYFNMIRSFMIEIYFPFSIRPGGTMELLYDYCDNLHRLVGRLLLIQKPLAHLKIVIGFGRTYTERDDAFSAMQSLLQPFRRLRNVASPEVLSVTIKDSLDREIEFLVPGGVLSIANAPFVNYVKCWSSSLSSSEPLPEASPVFEAYWQLEILLSCVRLHFHDLEESDQFGSLLRAARMAREAEDLTHFRKIWDEVVHIWLDFLRSQEVLRSEVASSINDIYTLIEN